MPGIHGPTCARLARLDGPRVMLGERLSTFPSICTQVPFSCNVPFGHTHLVGSTCHHTNPTSAPSPKNTPPHTINAP